MTSDPSRLVPLLSEVPVLRYSSGQWHRDAGEPVATEEPLELRVQFPDGCSEPLSVTMRTPGHDLDLVRGWLQAEGLTDVVTSLSQDPELPNVVRLRGDADALRAARRATTTSSACGVCGSGSVERLMLRVLPPIWTAPPLAAELICALPERLREAQPAFRASGGLHAAGLFTPGGTLLSAYEDVGRHNAVDKLVGACLAQDGGSGLPLSDRVLVTSSRAGFEIVQKALLAGVPVVVTVGAPSSLAIETAVSLGLTLVGFVRQGRFNVYAGQERLWGGCISEFRGEQE